MSIIRDITNKSFKYLDGDEILIFLGARQSGKTTILKQIQDVLKKEGKNLLFLGP